MPTIAELLPMARGRFDHEPEYPLMASRPIQAQQLSPFRELYEQGVRTLHVDATFSEDIFHPVLRAWQRPDVFDYSYQEAYWKSLIEACPEAKLCLRLYSASPPWWDAAHPEELQRYADGSTEAAFQRSERRTMPSLASEVWRDAACGALARFLGWLEDSGWSERIWGLFLCYGITWEWGILGTDKFPDYSEPMVRRFRQWLAEQYPSIGDLRRAWGDETVDFENAEIPLLSRRLAGEGGLRIFPRDRAAADFQNCLSDTNCDYLLALGRTVRRVSGTRYKLGTFYGYTLTAREHSDFTALYGPGGLAGGHHSFGRFLRACVFDFNASPYAYADRELGRGCLIQHFPRASCQQHGLHVYDENDLRSFLVAGLPDDRTISIGQTETLEETVLHQRWALAQALCHRTSYWWTELSDWIGPYQPYYDHPELLAELRRHAELFRRVYRDARPEKAEIAIIIDERAISALSLESKIFKQEIYEMLAVWSWCGAPFDIWLAEDVSRETMEGVRLAYVFSPAPSAKLRQHFREVLCGEGRTVWWGPLAGWSSDAGLDEAGFGDLTGFERPEETEALRRREFAGWVSLYGASGGMGALQLSSIAREAGVRIYGRAPLHVMKGRQFLAFQAADHRVAIALPEGEWENLWTGDRISAGTITLGRSETILLMKMD